MRRSSLVALDYSVPKRNRQLGYGRRLVASRTTTAERSGHTNGDNRLRPKLHLI